MQQPDHAIQGGLGWESTWAASIGYSAAMENWLPNRKVRLSTELTLPIPLIPTWDGGRFSGSVSALWYAGLGIHVETEAKLHLSWADSDLGSQTSFGTDLWLRPGYYATYWAAMLEIGWRAALATYIDHAESVETLFDDRYGRTVVDTDADPKEGPKDGWAALTTHRFFVGAATSVQVHRNGAVFLRGGLDLVPQNQSIIGQPPLHALPFYLEIGGDYRW